MAEKYAEKNLTLAFFTQIHKKVIFFDFSTKSLSNGFVLG
jgi:hypothetical protein